MTSFAKKKSDEELKDIAMLKERVFHQFLLQLCFLVGALSALGEANCPNSSHLLVILLGE